MDMAVDSAIEFLSHRRMSIFGRPARIITDSGANFVGEKFESFVSVWNITHICNPGYSAYQGGIFERAVGMLKIGTDAAMKRDPTISWPDAVCLAVTGRNLSPLMERGLAPLTIMTGRRNILDFIIDRDYTDQETDVSIHIPIRERNTKGIMVARAAIIEFESRDVISKCLSRKLRAHSEYVFTKDQLVQAWQGAQWSGGFRFLAQIHHNGIVERASKLTKAPMNDLRPLPTTIIDKGMESIRGSKDSPEKMKEALHLVTSRITNR